MGQEQERLFLAEETADYLIDSWAEVASSLCSLLSEDVPTAQNAFSSPLLFAFEVGTFSSSHGCDRFRARNPQTHLASCLKPDKNWIEELGFKLEARWI